MDKVIRKVEVKAAWEQLILPEEQLQQLHEITGAVEYHRKLSTSRKLPNLTGGITVLFSGPSGTGKTMAAEVLANHLALDLYRIDLAQVVNKYIGETEKNLDKIFDEAAKGDVILFFDEADALFGKRTNVRDSHDRYANVETGYLLERFEAHPGLVILTTNKKSALDEAFIRRLRFVLYFPIPCTDEGDNSADNRPILQLDPSDSLELTFALKKAVKQSGLSQSELVERLYQDYGVEITPSDLSHGINRGAIRFQRALQILAICGVSEVEIKSGTLSPRRRENDREL